MISFLKIDDVITLNPKVISNYVESFYSQLYKSIFQIDKCSHFLESVKLFVSSISTQFRDLCDEERLGYVRNVYVTYVTPVP